MKYHQKQLTELAIITFVSWSDGGGDNIDIEYGSAISHAIFNNSITGDFNVYTSDTYNTSVLGSITLNYIYGDFTKQRTYNVVDSTPPYFEAWSDGGIDSIDVSYGSVYTLPTAYFRDNTVAGVIVVEPYTPTINTSVLGDPSIIN